MLIIFALREAQKGKNLLSDNIIHLVKAENFFSNEKNYAQRIVSSIVNFSPTKSSLKRSGLYFLRRVFCMMNYYYKNDKSLFHFFHLGCCYSIVDLSSFSGIHCSYSKRAIMRETSLQNILKMFVQYYLHT